MNTRTGWISLFYTFFFKNWWSLSQAGSHAGEFSGWWFRIFFYYHPYLGKGSNLTNIFPTGWNHQEVLNFTLDGSLRPFGVRTQDAYWRDSRKEITISDFELLKAPGCCSLFLWSIIVWFFMETLETLLGVTPTRKRMNMDTKNDGPFSAGTCESSPASKSWRDVEICFSLTSPETNVAKWRSPGKGKSSWKPPFLRGEHVRFL